MFTSDDPCPHNLFHAYLVRRVFSFDAGRHLACMVVVFITAYPHLDKPFRMSREVKVALEGV